MTRVRAVSTKLAQSQSGLSGCRTPPGLLVSSPVCGFYPQDVCRGAAEVDCGVWPFGSHKNQVKSIKICLFFLQAVWFC